jgi:arylsulfatase A-like enzyme
MLIPAALASTAATLRPSPGVVRFAVFACVAIGVFDLMLRFVRIAPIASAALACGIAFQVARWVGNAPWARTRTMRRQAIALGLTLTLIGAGERAWRAVSERRAIAALPAATETPNVLLLILDTVRAANLGVYGYERATTPFLSRMAADAVVFERAFSTAPWTLPSHAGMFTGRYPTELSANWLDPLDDTHPTLAEWLAARGYLTSAFVANHQYTAWDSGLSRGFQRYDDYQVSFQQIVRSTWLGQVPFLIDLTNVRSANRLVAAFRNMDWQIPPKLRSDTKTGAQVTREFLEWQRGAGSRPWFAFLNYFDAHEPIHAPPPFNTRFAPRPGRKDQYDGAIAYLDTQIERIVKRLSEQGVLDRTIIVVSADHGELLGEHGLIGHAHNVYAYTLQVPLIVRYPARLAGGRRISTPVSLRDLATTISELVDAPDEAPFPGRSLTAFVSDTTSSSAGSPVLSQLSRALRIKPHMPAFRGSMRSVVEGDQHYILNGDGVEELYDYVRDPAESINLADSTRGRAVLPVFRGRTRIPHALLERSSVAGVSSAKAIRR